MADSHPGPSDSAPETKSSRWPWVIGTLILVGFVAIVLGIIFIPAKNVWTDDAYVQAHNAMIAPRISGQITQVAVQDNQMVRRGQLLASIDDRDYKTALDDALATLARDKAAVADASATVDRQPSIIGEHEARIKALQAKTSFAKSDANRYAHLAKTGAGTSQERQLSDTTWQEDQADLMGEQAALDAARHELDILKAKHDAAVQAVHADEARVEQARLNLSYTRLLAPIDGMVGAKTVQVGNYVNPGATLMAVIPMQNLFIEANYREVALKHVRPGQAVTIHLDAYDIDLNGIVDSIPPATGATFAPIAPENATGNFTKIVQRLPVKIVLAPNQPLTHLLRVGFSVETTIHTGLADVVGAQAHSTTPITLSHE